MKPFLFILTVLSSFQLAPLIAAENPEPRHWVASPYNRHLLTFGGDNPSLPTSFSIQDPQGNVLISSSDCPAFRDVAEYDPRHVLWSPDGNAVAIAAGNPKFLLTYILVRDGQKFVPVTLPNLPNGYDNPWILPKEWLKGATLRVAISGPHAGKADIEGYQGEGRLRLELNPPKCVWLMMRIK